MTEPDTLIIGGSAAGLAVARCLQEAGREALILEATAAPGTMWRNAYERLHLHTPRSRSGLPFRPMPRSYPLYPSRQQVVTYLEDYARALKVQPRYGQRVTAIRRDGERWRVDAGGDRYAARNVVLATGNTRLPVRPSWPGQDSFGGPIRHTLEYRTGAEYRGQRVLLVGFGNSACEIALDLHEHGAHPTFAVRGPVNVLPRDLFGIPILALGILQSVLPAAVADAINAPVIRLVVGDFTRYGLRKLPYGATTQIREHHQTPLLDFGTMALIRSGGATVRPGIERFTGDGVVFVDGRAEAFDAVLLGTGYRPVVSDILDASGVLDSDGAPLVSGGQTAIPGLFFCGFEVGSSGMLRQIGIEARHIASLIAG